MDSLIGVNRQALGNGPTVFAIQRFDRQGQLRIHREDFTQALEFAPGEKYGASNRGIGYDLLAKLVLDTCGREAAEDFVRRVAFVIACGNDDAHLKNGSFPWVDDRPRLSPAYDMVSTISWEGGPRVWSQKEVCRVDSGSSRHLRAKNWLGKCPRGLERACAQWPCSAEHAPPRMRRAIPVHWSNVPLWEA